MRAMTPRSRHSACDAGISSRQRTPRRVIAFLGACLAVVIGAVIGPRLVFGISGDADPGTSPSLTLNIILGVLVVFVVATALGVATHLLISWRRATRGRRRAGFARRPRGRLPARTDGEHRHPARG